MWEILHRDFVSILIRIMANTDEPARGVPYPPSTDPHHFIAWSIPADGQEEQEKFHVMSQGRLRLEAELAVMGSGHGHEGLHMDETTYHARSVGHQGPVAEVVHLSAARRLIQRKSDVACWRSYHWHGQNILRFT